MQPSNEDREEWVAALQTLMDYLKDNNDSDQKAKEGAKKEGWKWENASGEVAKKIQIENEEIFINDSEGT
jgi:hypothetical protein